MDTPKIEYSRKARKRTDRHPLAARLESIEKFKESHGEARALGSIRDGPGQGSHLLVLLTRADSNLGATANPDFITIYSGQSFRSCQFCFSPSTPFVTSSLFRPHTCCSLPSLPSFQSSFSRRWLPSPQHSLVDPISSGTMFRPSRTRSSVTLIATQQSCDRNLLAALRRQGSKMRDRC